jgi:hypothetical protein
VLNSQPTVRIVFSSAIATRVADAGALRADEASIEPIHKGCEGSRIASRRAHRTSRSRNTDAICEATHRLVMQKLKREFSSGEGKILRSQIDTRCSAKKLLTIFPLFVRFFLDTCEA